MLEKSKVITGMLAFLFFAVLSKGASGQSGDSKAVEILETLQERYEESIEGIDDYVLVKGDHTIYYKKAYDDEGHPYFKTKTENMEGVESTSARNEDLYSQVTGAMKDKATYEGTGEVEGHDVHILYVDELKIESFDDDPAIEDPTLEDLYLYIDSDKWVIRQMEYTAKFKGEEGKVREVSPVVQNRDYRKVEGMLIPYETSTIVTGLTLSEEERQKAKKGLKKFDKQLEEMPESQREMMEDMMGDKVEKYRKMVEEDRYESVEKVKEVRVNTGMEDF